MNIDDLDLTPEQKEKALNCKDPEELLKLAEEEDLELSEEQLEQISGGWCPFEDCENYSHW